MVVVSLHSTEVGTRDRLTMLLLAEVNFGIRGTAECSKYNFRGHTSGAPIAESNVHYKSPAQEGKSISK